MSTRIYNGRRVSLAFSQACQMLTSPELMAQLSGHIRTIRASKVLELALELKTLQAFRDVKLPRFEPAIGSGALAKSSIRDGIYSICEKHFLDSRGFFFKNRMDVENFLMVKPDPFSKEHTLVGLFFTQTELLALVEKGIALEDYHYQNSTDRPDEISEQEWEARGLSWGAALLKS